MVRTAMAVASALVALAFTLSTFERWLDGRRRHDLAWSAALAMFTIAAGALAAGAQLGWNAPTFKLFYLFGAIVDVPLLGLGTVYLLAGRRWGDPSALGVALFVAFAAGAVVAAPLTHAIPRHQLVQGSAVFGPLPRVLAAVGSGGGATVVLGGALLSAFRAPGRRVIVANGLIAAGTLILGASGLLNSVVGAMTAFAVALLSGIAVLFAGFLVATSGAAQRNTPLPSSAAPSAPEAPPMASITTLR